MATTATIDSFDFDSSGDGASGGRFFHGICNRVGQGDVDSQIVLVTTLILDAADDNDDAFSGADPSANGADGPYVLTGVSHAASDTSY